jgi:hypothetical protein
MFNWIIEFETPLSVSHCLYDIKIKMLPIINVTCHSKFTYVKKDKS